MKTNSVILSLLLIFLMSSFCEAKVKIDRWQGSYIPTDFAIFYNKETGKKYSKVEGANLLKKHSNLSCCAIVDEVGYINGYYLNIEKELPISVVTLFLRHSLENETPKIGEQWPNFIIDTKNGQRLNLKTLKGKYVIIRFQREIYRGSLDVINSIENQLRINKTHCENIIPIVIINRPLSETMKKEWYDKTMFYVKENGENFFIKYGIENSVTVIIDRNGKLIKVYSFPKKVNILDFYRK